MCRSSRQNDHKQNGRPKSTTILGPVSFDGVDLERHSWTCTNTTAGVKARRLGCKRQNNQTNTKSNSHKIEGKLQDEGIGEKRITKIEDLNSLHMEEFFEDETRHKFRNLY